MTAPTLLHYTEPPQPQLDTLFATANSVLLDVVLCHRILSACHRFLMPFVKPRERRAV